MPPKPPIRLPKKPSPIAKPRAPHLQASKPLPQTAPSKAAPRSTAPPSPPNPAQASRSINYPSWALNILVGSCAVIWVRDHYIRFDHIKGSSMSPTISPYAHETGREDWVVLRPYVPRLRSRGEDEGKDGIHRGDVVTFWKPHKPEETSIKRVVAVEGDVVYPRRGYALDPAYQVERLEGMPDGLQDEDKDSVVVKQELGRVVVPYGHVWLEGDNHGKSYDSNDFGPISKGLIQEKAVWVWRDWFGLLRVGDLRGNGGSRVVEGRSEIPDAFLE